jgi:hypothetical protein
MKFAVVVMGLLLASCTAFEPETGPFQGAREAGASTSGGYGTGPSTKPPPGEPDPRCAPDGGFVDDDCDLCENASCCAERFGCLDDSSCGAADDTFESCPKDAGSRPASCWNDLAASGPLAASFVSCVRAHCTAPCSVPP